MRLTKKLEAEVLALYKNYWDAYLKGDMKTFASYLDENIVVYGTAVGEIFTNKKDAVKFYTETADQMTGKAEFRNRTFNLKAKGETIVIFEQADLYVLMDGVWTFYDNARITGILEKKGNNWKLVHQHGSFPDNRTDEGDQISTDKIKTENIRLKKAIKRRTVELEQKNRELEIETTLEKVRSIAMGMREPADMLDVCKTISFQLQSLGVKEIRNVQTAIFYEQRGTYMNYEYYAKHDKTFITETIFTNNEIHNEFATKMLKGKGETFITHIKDDEVKDWITYQKTTNVFIDKYLETASSLNYYWFSLGPVALGISTYHPLTEEEINLFKRFLKVFELAYQRYLDIEKAEAQAREAQIEASLERVRAVAMSMNKSEDLLSICEVAYAEFKKLGFNNLRNAIIHILNDEKGSFLDYDYSDYQGGSTNNISYNSHPIVENYLKQIKRADDAFAKVVIGRNQLDGWKDFRRRSGQLDDPRLDKIPALYYYLYSIGVGDIGISTFKPIEKDQLDILKRFRNVFNLSYQRYSDIAQAEALAREAKIEAALEKVRAVAMSMNKPDDLLNVSEVVFKEFQKLGFGELRNAMINIHNDEKNTFINYDYSDEIGKSINHLTYNIHPVIEKQIKQIRSANDAFSETSFTGKDLAEWKKFRKKIGEKDDPRINEISALYYYFYSIGTGSIGISTFNSINEEKLELLKRFRNVFSLSYQRYSDIALAEAQAKEAQIELALERVRAKSLAMQQTSELQEVVNEVAQQLLQMNIDMDGGVIIIINDEIYRDVLLWGSAGAANYVQKATVPYLDIPIINRMISAIKKRESFLIERYTKEEKDEFMQHLFRHHPWDKLPPDRKNELLSREGGYCRSMSISRYTSIAIINHHGKVFSEADNNILNRFGNVLEQSFTRFLDLKNAEAQAREAQIEVALERVRSRTMGMQKSNELNEVIKIVYQQLIHLKINLDHAGFVVDYTPGGDWHFWIADEQDIPSKITHPYFESVWACQFNEAKEKGLDFFTTNLNFEEKNKFYNELLSYVPGLPQASKDFYLSCPALAATTVIMDNVGLYIENFSGILYSDEENKILIRFGKVFQQTYTRFLDLQKAEAQAKEAKIEAALERVRSRTMGMQRSDELQDAAVLLFQQVVELGVPAFGSGFNIWDDDRKFATAWMAGQDRMQPPFKTSSSEDIFLRIFEAAQSGESLFVEEQSGEALKAHYKYMFSIPIFKEIADKMATVGQSFPTFQIMHCAFFSSGYLMFISFEPVPDAYDIFKRFAKVFEQTYTRFLDLQKAEEQNKIIQADNERKTKELEDARQLQLSMLPKELPKLPHLDIAVYMKTATEVGGDYYDFSVDADGTLNVLVGDATGHGMMSGMMVSIMKSFFISNKANIELKTFFENANNSIKDMHLGRLMMATVGVQITSNKIIATNAGMPSLLYFRNKSQKAGEFVSHNFPLGAMKETKYLLKEINYEKGDTLLLMSDGFAELKNEKNEQYGYERVKKEFMSVTQKSSNEIVEHLNNSASEWINGIEPDDDVTFVVIKIK